jgi:prophage regulatory protein
LAAGYTELVEAMSSYFGTMRDTNPLEMRAKMSAAKIIRRKGLTEMTGLSISTILRYVKAGQFPPGIRLGPNSVGWDENDVQAWIESRKVTTQC